MKFRVCLARGLGIVALVLGSILLGAGTLSLTTGVAQAQGITVGSIVVQGNQRVEADTIRSYFRPGPGGRLDAFQIDEGVKALYSTGLFRDVRPMMQGGRLLIVVVENPVINRIAFEGNKKVKDEQLKAEIQSKERGTLSRPVVQADVARLVEVYRRSGRFDIRIDPKIIELPNNRVDLVFEITEGGEDRRQEHRVHRQPVLLGLSPARRHQDVEDRPAGLPANDRHLRPRPCRGGSRAASPLLSQARLHRRSHRLRGRRIRSGAERLPDHLHDRGRRAISRRLGRGPVERTRDRSGAAAAETARLRG